jgi:hypothetical protein
MSKKPVKRFARTPDTILVALGLAPSGENRKKLKYWRTFQDFPKKQRNGYAVDELSAFIDAHLDEFVAIGKRAKAIEETDKFSAADLKLLNQAKPGPIGAASPPMDVDDEPLAKNQTAIANWLAHHFQVPVSKMDISDWLRGERLEANVPNFPVPDAAGRFNKLKSADWFRAHKFHDPRDTTTPDLFKRLETERATSEMERLDHERIMRGVERGLYLEKAEHNRILAGLGRIGRDNLWELFDRRAYDMLTEALRAANVPDEISVVCVNAARKINPELLLKHHAHLEACIQEAEAEVPAPQNLNHR